MLIIDDVITAGTAIRESIEIIREAVARGCRQVVILGAGLDARAVRLAAELGGWPEASLAAETQRPYPPYWIGFDTRTHAIFANLLRKLPKAEPAIHFELDFERDATQACFAMADHPGIFARLARAS